MANASLTQTLDEVALTGVAWGPDNAALNVPLSPVTISAASIRGRIVATTAYLAGATLSSQATLGTRPDVVVLPARLYNLTGLVRDSGGAILCFQGPPWKSVEWRMVQGQGTLTPFTTYTDELGRASCRFDCGYVGTITRVVVGVAYVP